MSISFHTISLKIYPSLILLPMYYIVSFIFLMGIWIAFSGLLDAFHLTLGVLSCAFVSIISTRIIFENSETPISVFIGRCIQFFFYLFWLLKEIVLSNLHVFSLVMIPGGMKKVSPELITLKVQLKNDWARYLLANSITLTPGTVSAKIDGDELLVHSISRKTTEGLEGDMEKRIAKIFGESIQTS